MHTSVCEIESLNKFEQIKKNLRQEKVEDISALRWNITLTHTQKRQTIHSPTSEKLKRILSSRRTPLSLAT